MLNKIKTILKKAYSDIEKKFDIRKSKFAIRLILCIVILLLGITAFAILSSIKHKPKEKPKEELLKTLLTVPVKIKDYRYEFTGYGTVKPFEEITVFAEAQGHINYISDLLEEGSFVKKGDILLKIEDIDYQLALKEAETELVSFSTKISMKEQDIKDGKEMLTTFKRRMDFNKSDYLRKEKLWKKKVTSLYEVEEAGKKFENAKNLYLNRKSKVAKDILEVKSLKSDLARAYVKKKQAEINLARSTVKAPINGRVESIQVNNDEYVSKGSPLFEINNHKNLEIKVPVDIEDALFLFKATNAKSKNIDAASWFRLSENISITIYWTGNSQCIWKGKILRIEKFDAETRTITISVSPGKYIGNETSEIPLVEGMFCKVLFKGKTVKNTIKIPWASLQLNKKIFVVNKSNIVYGLIPKIINSNSNDIIISSDGLNPGENIVAQRVPSEVVSGTKVNVLSTEKVK